MDNVTRLLKTSSVYEIVIDPDAGASYGACAQDAILLSAALKVDVSFVFNDEKNLVNYKDVLRCCMPAHEGEE